MSHTTFNAEENLHDFVQSRTGERVVLDIPNPSVLTIKSKAKRGSTILAIFWVNLLQHKNNYPVQRYPYRDLYDRNGSHRVILRVDDVAITIFMSNGTMMIQGEFVLDWFLKCFTKVMEAYDLPIKGSRPVADGYKSSEEQWAKLEVKEKARKEKELKELREKYELELMNKSSTQISTEQREHVETKQVTDTENEAVAEEKENGQYVENGVEITTHSTDDLCDEMELMNLDVWTDETLQKQLDFIRTPAVKEGPTYIYKLWKSLLDRWFADADNKVYIVTPFLDSGRMMDICDLVLKHHLTANIDAFYVRMKCEHGQKISDVKRKAQNQYNAKDQVFIEYKIYNRIVYPLVSVHAKFIACIHKDGQAEVLLTSANFHGDHFVHSNRDHLVFHSMPEIKFIQRFLKPLNTSDIRQ